MNIEEIYREYDSKIKAYILRRVNNPEDAQDLHSEVFLKVQKKMAEYDQTKGAVSTWIYTIAHNTIIDYYRTNRMMDSIDSNEEEGALTPSQLIVYDEPDADLINKETLAELAQALMELDDEEKTIVVYHYYDGLSLKDVAEKTGLTYGQVKLRHAAALKVLRKFFQKRSASGTILSYK